ncbi:hypothetical protein JYB87_11870 [Shewanella avicenniae]|uniref:Peptidase n=1 Tax=Shewanella avicenniae TaxID=2814294 RepID=A0ABX7QMI2_9GAMM|nr:hypothetical protein [Shewanella avicenniae]QSX32464.1 hypothetical protein JYB87_11870 [Shewanella avicenniae]
MKQLHIFKTGRHTAANGQTLDFNEDILQDAAASYDPQLHEAPIVIGHPRDNAPAYGWIKSLSFSDGNISAEPHQVNADFEEMVQKGLFKKISASWYLPDSPNNPKQGTLYLRHVGFLGAQPPAIKGLNAVEFSEADKTIEFEESLRDGFNLQDISRVFKRLRDFLIDKYSRDEADDIIPDYIIEELKDSGQAKIDTATQDITTDPSNFNESENMNELEEAKSRIAALEAENDTLKSQIASFSEQAKARRKAEIETKVDALIAAGKVPAANRAQTIAFAETIDTNDTIEFAEGDNKKKGADAYLASLEQLAGVDFNEHSRERNEGKRSMTSHELAQKAVEYQEAQRKAGNLVTIDEAVNHINNQLAE